MANQEHLDILAKGVKAWNEWRTRLFDSRPDLSHANLSGAHLNDRDLSGADLNGARLSGADLSGADLSGAGLNGAHLSGANLSGANLRAAHLNDANLRYANLREANLNDANLVLANLTLVILTGAKLSGARCDGTHFAHVDLSAVLGLDDTIHQGPSYIDIQTIYRSKGQISEVFLRGAGVPENFITYMHSLTGAAFEFYSCFISYSTKDQEFADRLYADLQAKGVRCWFAPHDIQAVAGGKSQEGGKKVHEQIDEAIRLYDKLLLILSDASMNSKWVKTEIANARAREEQQKRQMLFPITLVPFEVIKAWKLFDADIGTDSAGEIREYFIPDFSKWKDHDSYRRAFERLLGDLKAQPGEKAEAKLAVE
jgi:hypothetical protein